MLVSYKKWLAGHEQVNTLQRLRLYRTKNILSNMFARFTSVFITLFAMTGIVAAAATNPNTCAPVCCDSGVNVSHSVRLLLSSPMLTLCATRSLIVVGRGRDVSLSGPTRHAPNPRSSSAAMVSR